LEPKIWPNGARRRYKKASNKVRVKDKGEFKEATSRNGEHGRNRKAR